MVVQMQAANTFCSLPVRIPNFREHRRRYQLMSDLGTADAPTLDGIAHGGPEGFADLNLVKVSVLHSSSQ